MKKKSSTFNVSLFFNFIIIDLDYMLKYKINIIELEPLYLILFEIKDKLNFEIKNFKKLSDFLKEFENNQDKDFFNYY